MKFREVKYAKQFIARGLEINAITQDHVEEVMECEIDLSGGRDTCSKDPMHICLWGKSGLAGYMLRYICNDYGSWRATDYPTPCPECEALKARVKELKAELQKEQLRAHMDKNTNDELLNEIKERDGIIETLTAQLKAHGIETQTEVM